MSTVSKEIADRIVEGEFPEDGVLYIVKYQNSFNGADAYKLCFSEKYYENVMLGSPYVINPVLWWKKNND